jgi:hypothetical protein
MEGASLQRDAHCGDEEIEQETTKVAFRAIKNYFPFFGAIKNYFRAIKNNSTREFGGGGGWAGLGRAILLTSPTIYERWSVIEKKTACYCVTNFLF